jgi:hypothetical protein
MRWAGYAARMGMGTEVYKVLVWKRERKRPLGRLRRRWEDGIRKNLRQIDWGGGCGVDSIGSGCEPVVDSCEHSDETSGYGAT